MVSLTSRDAENGPAHTENAVEALQEGQTVDEVKTFT